MAGTCLYKGPIATGKGGIASILCVSLPLATELDGEEDERGVVKAIKDTPQVQPSVEIKRGKICNLMCRWGL